MTEDRGDSVGISADELINCYPHLYHMAEPDTWESIRRHGLLSTSALLDLFEIQGDKRYSIESQRRPQSVRISHHAYGSAVIRDQKPMFESALNKCLEKMSPRQWYELLNRRVFFWPTRKRLLTLLSAKPYRTFKHCVITIDTALLLQHHVERITLSHINSGSTVYKAQPRGHDTFLGLPTYPFGSYRKRTGLQTAIAEIAVDYSVPDIERITIRAEHMTADKIIESIYER